MGLTLRVWTERFFQLYSATKNDARRSSSFFGAMVNTHYMIPLLFGTQTLTGVLLLINRFVPLALALIAPVIVNILAFHLFVEPSGLPIACVVAAIEIYLAWSYK